MQKTLLHILMHIGRLLERAAEGELAPIGLHHGQGRILLAIASCDAITQADLARLMDIKPATVTNMLKPLEEKKLIQRKTDAKTNRAVIVSLSPVGKKVCTQIQAAWDRIEARMTGALPEAGRDELFQALEIVRNSLGGQPSEDRTDF
jgi:DNA-binding MarR family transcriptional regulator